MYQLYLQKDIFTIVKVIQMEKPIFSTHLEVLTSISQYQVFRL